MLKQLSITSLGLIDNIDLNFSQGFTTITGETGSGKTSLIEALKLTLGKKSDFDFIKKGEKKAVVQALFEVHAYHPIFHFLQENELKIESGEPIIITRQLFFDGKSKAFINQQTVSVQFLQKLSGYLCDFIDQNDLLKIYDEYYFHILLDQTGQLEIDLKNYQISYQSFLSEKKTLEGLYQQSGDKEIKIKILESEIDELKRHNICDNEEPKLFESYKKTQQSADKVIAFEAHNHLLSQEFLPQLRKLKSDKSLNDEQKNHIQNAYASLCELSHNLEFLISESQIEPTDLTKMEDRLKIIHQIKKKYNLHDDEFSQCLQNKMQQLDELAFLDDKIKQQEHLVTSVQSDVQKHALSLDEKRKTWAQALSKKLQQELRMLNMPYAEVEFVFKESAFHDYGNSAIDFFIKTNAQSNMIPLKTGASGGELARVNFCFFLSRATLHPSVCYFFDEIDAHVGGITSTLLGDKLQKLAKEKQIFCVTHFPQMAQKGHNHLVFKKIQQESKTEIIVEQSTNGPILEEIDRMIGLKM